MSFLRIDTFPVKLCHFIFYSLKSQSNFLIITSRILLKMYHLHKTFTLKITYLREKDGQNINSITFIVSCLLMLYSVFKVFPFAFIRGEMIRLMKVKFIYLRTSQTTLPRFRLTSAI